MIENIFFFAHYALTLLFGIILSFAFCGLRFSRKDNLFIFLLFALSGLLQLAAFSFLGESATWQMYPLIVHLPLAILLCTVFRKRIATVLAAISLSYLCCQPANWVGLLSEVFINNPAVIFGIRMLVMAATGIIVICFFSPYISEIFNKDTRSIIIFSSIPLSYYLFDYSVGIYTDLWNTHSRLVSEFLPFFLCICFVAFCVIYYKEYEKKADAQRKEQIVQITVQQQAKEIDAIKKSNLETRLLRHDMRLLLDSLALSIEHNDRENSLKMISGFVSKVEAASLHRYCENDTLNYILTNFETKCRERGVIFEVNMSVTELSIDEVILASIISNALDNAINAQEDLPQTKRRIKLMLKDSDGKLLLSVKNPFKEEPAFVNGFPISNRKGHGYGTQSIRYLTERLGGKCQFSLENDMFLVRVVL